MKDKIRILLNDLKLTEVNGYKNIDKETLSLLGDLARKIEFLIQEINR